MGAQTLSKLEDLYLPYRPKKRTRAMIAKEKGAARAARRTRSSLRAPSDPSPSSPSRSSARKKASRTSSKPWPARATSSPSASARTRPPGRRCRWEVFFAKGASPTPAGQRAARKPRARRRWAIEFDCEMAGAQGLPHRVLAMRRGEKEGFLYMRVELDEAEIVPALEAQFAKGMGPCAAQRAPLRRGRVLPHALRSRSPDRDARWTKKRADREAIAVFAGATCARS